MKTSNLWHEWAPFLVYLGFLTWLLFRAPGGEPSWPWFDKAAHLGSFALLGVLGVRLFHPLEHRWSRGHLVGVAFLITLVYGGLTEWGQGLTHDRSAEWGDLLMDALGGLMGGGVYWWGKRVWVKRVQSANITV